VAFVDDESFAPPTERRATRGGPPDRFGGPDRQQQIMARRLVAVVIGVAIIVLLVLGIRGCLNAREERAYENYIQDLTALTSESKNVSDNFFARLEDPQGLSPLEFEAEVKADRGAAEGLVTRAEGLDPPGTLSEAQDLVVLSFELRRDALAAISEQIGAAFAREGSDEAIDAITAQMRAFLASDVLYARAQDVTAQILEQENINPSVPGSQFLPDSPNWLDRNVVADALGGVSGSEAGAATPGVHGLALLQTTLQPTGAILEEGVPTTASADGAELEVEVQNQGDSEESGVVVTYDVQGGASGEETIPQIGAGETTTVNLPLNVSPGDASITVEVQPVAGEEIKDNNSATYEVTFE
jgi:hypothetical protein